ncbi:hypothetical protein NEF87_000717 [Candidatus Lokiarchaeum ossiferum]|uniref:Uncharacterized protein n=1 Tax=Candidatus Lokiarchaeum ossiferum TaxID=2951803 RepID=A0ABY6HLQ0_9ARCH|nr:hypothetical protein NEF87_000717 [Candidatus Lokiarchaeum sp. B-35]
MANPQDQLSKKSLEEKINGFGQILQNFGLNLIQNIGEMKHELSILSDKVGKIEEEVHELRDLKYQLHETNRSRSEILNEAQKIKNHLSKLSLKFTDMNSENFSKQDPQENKTALDVLNDLERKVRSISTAHELLSVIKASKEELFIITGGHKILFDIKTFERKIKPGMDIIHENVSSLLLEKIEDWKLEL